MAFCSECGAAVAPDAKYCAKCGKQIDSGATPATTPVPPVTSAPSSSPQTPIADPAHQPGRMSPVAPTGGNAAMWILPAVVLVALLAVAYLFLARRDGGQQDGGAAGPVATASSAATPADTPAATGESAGAAVPTQDAPAPVAKIDDDSAPALRQAPSGAMTYVTARRLDAAFSLDRASASVRYTAPITVIGTIASMVQPGTTPSLSMEGRTQFNYIAVSFPLGYGPQLAPLRKGQVITVACDTVRSLAGTTMLSGCQLS